MDSSSIASGGSGSASSASNSRSSTPNILFAVSLLLISLLLLGLSRRIYRLKTSLGLGLCFALAGWAITVSRMGASASIPDLGIWGITAGLFILGAGLGAAWLWMVGLAGIAVASGFAFALSVLLMCQNGGIDNTGGRWGLLAAFGVLSLVALALSPPKWRKWLEVNYADVHILPDKKLICRIFRHFIHLLAARPNDLCRKLALLHLDRPLCQRCDGCLTRSTPYPRHKQPSLAFSSLRFSQTLDSASNGSILASHAFARVPASQSMAKPTESACFAY